MRAFSAEAMLLPSALLNPIAAFPSPDGAKRQFESSGAMEVVQAQVPPRKNYQNPSCTQTIFNPVFANSYGKSYVGTYSPPKDCEFTTTIFNISITSSGRQYDRLALLFFGDIEIWRTSTAMPGGYDIYWNYQKDMTIFDTLIRSEQKIIFDLDNVYSELYTGEFSVILEALYFNDQYANLDPAHLVYPISALASSQNISSVMSLPDDNGTVSITFPRNVKSAVVSILASGNGNEEFWYTNVPSQYTNTFPSNAGWLYGYSPFREIELFIDGNLAGVSWPFPIVFTGGVDPGLWRPIAGIDAYDLPSFEVDITPWLPLLCDGHTHTLSLKVVGYDSSTETHIGTVGENWYVTGSVFVWLDKEGKHTTGSSIESHDPNPSFSFVPELTTVTINGTTTNSSLYFSLSASRKISISSIIHTSTGPKLVSWTQDLSFSNIQNMTAEANNQSLAMMSSATFSNSFSKVTNTYHYPINLFSAYVIAPWLATLSSVYTLIDRSLVTSGVNTITYLTGTSTGKETFATRQNASSMYHWNETIVQGTSADTGITEQWLTFSGKPGSLGTGVSDYSRKLKEVDDYMLVDQEAWAQVVVPKTEPLPFVEGEPSV